MLGNVACLLLSSVDLFSKLLFKKIFQEYHQSVKWFESRLGQIYFQNYYLKKSFRNIIRVSNGLNLDWVRHFVEPDLGLNCLQM